MKLFLWTLIALLAITCLGKLASLVNGDLPPRTPGWQAADVAFNAALLVWAAVLLAEV